MDNAQTLPAVRPDDNRELSISRAPNVVLDEAQKAAAALKDVISKKAKKVSFNGEQYIEAEDWQTIGKFYNVAAKVEWTKYVEFGTAKGYEARAVVIHIPTGNVISAAEAMCTNDERNWGGRSLNQIRSMAQTRASAKALRTVLAWVVVMAGYKPTPVEEMDLEHEAPARPAKQAPPPADDAVTWDTAKMVSDVKEMLEKLNGGDAELMDNHLKQLTKWTDKQTKTEKWLSLADLPGVAKHKPDWLKGVHQKVLAEYTKAFDGKGNPK